MRTGAHEIKPSALARKIAALSLTKKAEDVVILDLQNITSMTDFFVICSGDTDKQVRAISDAVTDGLIEDGIKAWHREGFGNAKWVLLDFVHVVTHVFMDETRKQYNLEQLWGDAPATRINDESELVNKE